MSQVEKNLEVKKMVEEMFGMSWEKLWQVGNWSNLIGSFRTSGGRCVKCGGYVTSLNLKFFNFNVTKVLCYKCQGKN